MRILVEELDKLLKENKDKTGVVHDTGRIKGVLPFNSSKRTTVMRDRYDKVLGEFTRIISNVQLPELDDEAEIEYEEINPIASKVSDEVECDNEDIRLDLNLFLNSYLFSEDNEFKSIHPYIFNYTPLSKQKPKRSEEERIARFMINALIDDITNFQSLFFDKQGEDILTTLVLDNLGELKERKTENIKYKSLLPILIDMFKEDFDFLSKRRDYFMEQYPLLVKYYYFLYISQLALKFHKYETADYEKVDPSYFALDWETGVNKRRKAVSVGGYKTLRERSKELFIHIHVMSHLSYNSKNEDEFLTYVDILGELKTADEKRQFIGSLNNWIKIYHEKAKLNLPLKDITTLSEGFSQLFKCLEQGMNKQVYERYGESIEDPAIKSFLKHRGSHGYTLNITQELLLLLTAISVKDQRIPLKKLFEEFEKRGIALDRYSMKEVTDLLDSLNLIEKKSDSGDAQYVKPIL
ncbi:DNA phosphorothioation-dependent restriction protein DptG [Bacillus salitolerans]|uniref:DNA phosphorothioation-dependent restriction protein DptG n=1 Tax=Bacillus salitolerans TaxID=1437434 RepID=A0ABW4LY85_9BACI